MVLLSYTVILYFIENNNNNKEIEALPCIVRVDMSMLQLFGKLRQSYDALERGGHNDILSVEGFLVALRDTLRLKKGGTLWGGLPCSTLLGYEQCTGMLYVVLICKACNIF